VAITRLPLAQNVLRVRLGAKETAGGQKEFVSADEKRNQLFCLHRKNTSLTGGPKTIQIQIN